MIIDRNIQTSILNHSGNHLLDQNQRSMRGIMTMNSTACALKGRGGLSCSTGSMIKYEHYHIRLEELPVHDYEVLKAIGKSNENWKQLSPVCLDLMRNLQDIHDVAKIENWMREIEKLELEFNIKFTRKKGKQPCRT